MQPKGIGRRGQQNHETSKRKNFLFAIGINDYGKWPRLSNAVKDVEDITELLVTGYQFKDELITKLLNQDATERKIYKEFRRLKSEITKEDNLIIYFSGHGHYDEILEQGYWVPVDADLDDVGDYISNANVVQFLQTIQCHHILLIIDSCFSGTLISGNRNAPRDEAFPSRRIFASGRKEVVDDGRPGHNSPFAKGIIDFLTYNNEKSARTSDLINFVKDFVQKNATQTPVEGRITNSNDAGGEFFFHKNISDAEYWASIRDDLSLEKLEKYLHLFPMGDHVGEANQRIRSIQEDLLWQKAIRNGTPDGFTDYIDNYPGGKYFLVARMKLEEARREIEEQQRISREMAKRIGALDRIRNDYRKLVKEAEDLFQKQQYQAAHKKYWEASSTYIEGYNLRPKKDYLEERIEKCNDEIHFKESLEDGRRAFNYNNDVLALEYLEKAQSIKKGNKEVKQLIKECKERIESKKRVISVIKITEKKKIDLGRMPNSSIDIEPKIIRSTENDNSPINIDARPRDSRPGNTDTIPVIENPKPVSVGGRRRGAYRGRINAVINPRRQQTERRRWEPKDDDGTSQSVVRYLTIVGIVIGTILLVSLCNNANSISSTGTTDLYEETKETTPPIVRQRYGFISGTEVILRSSATTQSKILDKITQEERVQILESDVFEPAPDAYICKTPTTFWYFDEKNARQKVPINAGKALRMVTANSQPGFHKMEVEIDEKTKKVGFVEQDKVEKFQGAMTWYKVKYKGKIGWVYGKYLKEAK